MNLHYSYAEKNQDNHSMAAETQDCIFMLPSSKEFEQSSTIHIFSSETIKLLQIRPDTLA